MKTNFLTSIIIAICCAGCATEPLTPSQIINRNKCFQAGKTTGGTYEKSCLSKADFETLLLQGQTEQEVFETLDGALTIVKERSYQYPQWPYSNNANFYLFALGEESVFLKQYAALRHELMHIFVQACIDSIGRHYDLNSYAGDLCFVNEQEDAIKECLLNSHGFSVCLFNAEQYDQVYSIMQRYRVLLKDATKEHDRLQEAKDKAKIEEKSKFLKKYGMPRCEMNFLSMTVYDDTTHCALVLPSGVCHVKEQLSTGTLVNVRGDIVFIEKNATEGQIDKGSTIKGGVFKTTGETEYFNDRIKKLKRLG